MYLTRHQTDSGPRWALDGYFLPAQLSLSLLMELPAGSILGALQSLVTSLPAGGPLLPPVESQAEIWAGGVTYLRSRDARVAEAQTADIYERVYRAERPELFFKATGNRVVGPGGQIRIRRDSNWNVPEPELVLVANAAGEIIGYTAGNDVSSRSIEAENPLYLPQAKVYTGSCALGPGIVLYGSKDLRQLPVQLSILRNEQQLFAGETSIGNMKRSLEELLAYLYRELDFPNGAYLLTGTGIVPPDEFSLQPGDRVVVKVGGLSLENQVV